MKCRAAAPLFLFLACTATSAEAQSLPAIKSNASNKVAACATPGRLMAFVKERNDNLDSRFEGIATAYMRYGEELGVRWDYAFFQMLLETGNLSYRRGNGRPGDVRPSQYNFAGLGATGRGVSGESFPDLASGVKAHLQHLLLYAGDHIADPVAERTRKVQEWGVLTSWQKSLRGPTTFGNLSRQWAPGDRNYGRNIAAIAEDFYDKHCNRPDPNPELLAEAHKGQNANHAKSAAAPATAPKVSGAELARRAIEEARNDRSAQRSSLGAATIAGQAVGGASPGDRASAVKTVSAATGAASAAAPAASNCRVWTASYGGQKAIIIKSVSDDFVNYTVLDVNEGAEKRETDAYIAAYAKGGQAVGEFSNQTSALDRAFELCPEG